MPRYTQPRRTWHNLNEFKVKAVQLSLLEGVQVQEVAKTLDIHPFMLSRWRKEYREGKLVVGKKRVERLMRALGLQGRMVQVTRRQPGLRRFQEMGENLRLGLPTRAQEAWPKGKCQSVGLLHRQWAYGIVFPYLESRTNPRSQVSHYDGITLCFEQLH